MRAGELNGSHLGQRVQVVDVRSDLVVAGTLLGLRHEGNQVEDRPISREHGVVTIGRITVVLEYANHTEVRTSTTSPVELLP